jgi:hypothetical protein
MQRYKNNPKTQIFSPVKSNCIKTEQKVSVPEHFQIFDLFLI